MNQPESQTDSLEKFVKNSILASEYERLHERLGISKTALTRMFRRPQSEASADNVCELAKICSCDPKFLVVQFQMGKDTILLAEALQMGFQLH